MRPFDVVGFIIEAESGELEREDFAAGVQHLIDSGIIFQLQGSWQRTAQAMIDAGECTPPTNRRAA